jgi:hypothetical protein
LIFDNSVSERLSPTARRCARKFVELCSLAGRAAVCFYVGFDGWSMQIVEFCTPEAVPRHARKI